MAIYFRCRACGVQMKIADHHANARMICPRCKAENVVPPGNPQPLAPYPNASTGEKPSQIGWPPGMVFVLAGVILALLIILGGVAFKSFLPIALFLLVLIAVPVLCWLYVLLVKSRAIDSGAQESHLFFRLVKMVLWNPTEGILFLKNKQIDFVDSSISDGGGIRFLFPVLGQEIGLRLPLTVQTTEMENKGIYTRDSIPVDMKLTVWWRVRDLGQFFLSVGKELHKLNDAGTHVSRGDARPGFAEDGVTVESRKKLEVAESWIRVSMEEEVRRFASGMSTSLLVTEKIASPLSLEDGGQNVRQLPSQSQRQLPAPALADRPHDSHQPPVTRVVDDSLGTYLTASNQLVQEMQPKLNSQLYAKGLEIDRVALQDVALPPEIRQKAIDAVAAWHGVIEARRLGEGEAARLEELCKVLGKDTVGLKEVLKNYQGTNISIGGGLSGVLDTLFAGLGKGMDHA